MSRMVRIQYGPGEKSVISVSGIFNPILFRILDLRESI
jgi:hypothetical protein